MIISASGASGNPIYFGVDQTWFAGDSWSRPVFDLENSTWFTAPVLASSSNFVTFDNLEIANEAADNSGSWPPRSSISVNGGSNITIQNCYIHGWSIQDPIAGSDFNPTGGIAFYNGSVGSVVQNCVLDGSPESDSGIGIYGGTSIQGNIVENVPNGIVLADPDADAGGNQVFNVAYSVDPSMGSGAISAYANANLYNNIVHDLVPGASAIDLESGTSALGNTQYVYNNLVWNAGDTSPITIASDKVGSLVTSNQFIYNNTLSGGATSGCVTVDPSFFSPANLAVQNNQCISEQPSSQAWCWNNAGGSFACGPVANLTFGNNILMTTEAAASQGYTLSNSFQPSSPSGATVAVGLNLVSNCVTVGASLCSDLLGVVRPGGSAAWDAGAYQYQTIAGSIAPVITMQPVRQSVAAGQTATFSVIAAGATPLNYQWQKNGTAILGATSSTYTSLATTASDDGTSITVVVSNSVGSAISSPAILSVNLTPGQLTPNPTSLNFGSVTIGTSITASVTLTNTSSDYVTISNVSVSGPGFSVSGVPPRIILAPGEVVNLNVAFTPEATGAVPGSVTVSSDAAGSPIVIPLSGLGIEPPHLVSIAWDPSTSPVFGYYVYRATDLYGPYTRLNSTPTMIAQYTDVAVQPGETYLYWVTSVDSNTLESVFSNSISATIPAP
jgi:putative cofactor-binding repeat protein